MRVDRLSRREEAKVSLIEGDFYTALPGKSARRTFELEIPEVETEIGSRNFWVRRDRTGSKFANYDEQVLRVAARGRSVTLGRNEAALVRHGKPPGEKIDALAAPALQAPEDDSVAFNAAVELAWSDVAEAAGYWLEVALDPAFDRMTMSRWGVAAPRAQLDALDIGTYYWRAIALDKFGLPGMRSHVRRFHVRIDQSPPFLIIEEPEEGAIIRAARVRLHGETEAGATVSLDGKPLPIGGWLRGLPKPFAFSGEDFQSPVVYLPGRIPSLNARLRPPLASMIRLVEAGTAP